MGRARCPHRAALRGRSARWGHRALPYRSLASTMRVTVLGLWHLGCVTAACCAERFAVQGLDMDAGLIARLNEGQPPISEPGLAELIQTGLRKGALSFSTDIPKVCANTD